ncbi:MAG: hypothetical protein KDG55_18140 [Rhodocyclaceae bacterium]|nr:hypothetical protein [Rhodocyclaceae bacterium]
MSNSANTFPASRLSTDQLTRIIEEAMFYQCACPAQIARALLDLQELYKYQRSCQSEREADLGVHARIMLSAERAYSEFEICLIDVLTMEDWDMDTLTMPEGLRRRRDAAMDGGG